LTGIVAKLAGSYDNKSGSLRIQQSNVSFIRAAFSPPPFPTPMNLFVQLPYTFTMDGTFVSVLAETAR
jgi:hypothetical protein